MDDFGKHHNMIAIPALMANRDDLTKYVNEEYNRAELVKVKEQCEFLLSAIKTKLLTQSCGDPEKFKAEHRRSSRSRLMNDIRFKDPKTLSITQKIMWSQVRSQYSDEQWDELQKRLKSEWDELHIDKKNNKASETSSKQS
jgi:hypothetical protein